ncbi:hypothetical protein HY409_01905 [Candidatus Gottesmanbacteria bacterium]|nr:hypothetical protein [Candidatus Gottesmanbacteria bacterium]
MSLPAEQERGRYIETQFRDSWLTEGVPLHIVDQLARSQPFLELAGLWALPASFRPSDLITKDSIRPHVVEYFGAHDEVLRYVVKQKLLEAATRTHPTEIFELHEYQGAIIELHTRLLLDLLNHRGMDYSIETLAEMFIRPPVWEFPEGLQENFLEAFVQAKNGTRYKIFLPHLKERRKWKPEDWDLNLSTMHELTYEDRTYIRNEIAARRQPYINLSIGQAEPNTPLTARPAFGVNLATLTPEEINKLAQHGYFCDPTCHRYHGDVDMYKSLQELIAPVDAAVIGERLLERYNIWAKTKKRKEKFRVLIPAQADETTIAGLLDYLQSHNIHEQEIHNNFSFVLADLCVTPLLRVYAEVKKRKLLKIANIVSMDVFNWKNDGETFHFIAADHFIDLFPPEIQKLLIVSLTNCLTADGELVLTTRCGINRPINAQDVMNDFYHRTDGQISRLLKKLNTNPSIQVAQAIYALLVYRQLRKVYPFTNLSSLNTALSTLAGYDAFAAVIGKNKARITVNKNRITEIDPLHGIRTLFRGATG